MDICNNILDAIGETPLVSINRLNPNLKVQMLAQVEGFEPTSGNTGIALAMIWAVKGYKYAS